MKYFMPTSLSQPAQDLISKILVEEEHRLSIDQVLSHPFITHSLDFEPEKQLTKYITPMPEYLLLKNDKTHKDVIQEAKEDEEETMFLNEDQLDQIPMKDEN